MATVRDGSRGVRVVVVAMAWLSCPGRTSSTATAEDAGFVVPGGPLRS